jgi:hypothetical protein
MKTSKSTANSGQRTRRLSARVFVRAARFATLLVVVVCSLEFLAMSAVLRDVTALWIGGVLIALMAVAIWITAAVLGTVLLIPVWLWEKRHYAVFRTRRSIGARSGVWDDWLDWPCRA